MAIRIILIGLIVLAAAGLSVIGMQTFMPRQAATVVAPPVDLPQAPAPIMIRTLVAARPIPAGSLLRTEDLGVREMPTDQAGEGALRDTPEVRAELAGALVRRYLTSCVQFAFGPDQVKGLQLYGEKLAQHGLLPAQALPRIK